WSPAMGDALRTKLTAAPGIRTPAEAEEILHRAERRVRLLWTTLVTARRRAEILAFLHARPAFGPLAGVPDVGDDDFNARGRTVAAAVLRAIDDWLPTLLFCRDAAGDFFADDGRRPFAPADDDALGDVEQAREISLPGWRSVWWARHRRGRLVFIPNYDRRWSDLGLS
ncbi:MAG: hypothetical protein ACRDD1_13855, partial [Planctomycetia bacterium]